MENFLPHNIWILENLINLTDYRRIIEDDLGICVIAFSAFPKVENTEYSDQKEHQGDDGEHNFVRVDKAEKLRTGLNFMPFNFKGRKMKFVILFG